MKDNTFELVTAIFFFVVVMCLCGLGFKAEQDSHIENMSRIATRCK